MFASAAELAACDAVGLVVVAVQAAAHREVTIPALESGKAVYCEWPLARNVTEAVELAELARRSASHAVVGLQARSAPVIKYVRDLVAEGWLGEVLSSTVVASGMSWGGESDPRTRYLLDRDRGSTMLSIPGGHVLDAVTMCLGEFVELDALMVNRRPWVRERASGERVRMTTDDQVAVHGVLDSGAVIAVHLRGGRSRGTNFQWEINGTEGDLVVTGEHGHIQLAPVTLRGGRGADSDMVHMPVPERYYPVRGFPDGPAANLGGAYAALLSDLETGERTTPDFEHGLRRHRLVDAIEQAAASGSRVTLNDKASPIASTLTGTGR